MISKNPLPYLTMIFQETSEQISEALAFTSGFRTDAGILQDTFDDLIQGASDVVGR